MTFTKLEERIVQRRGILQIPLSWNRLGSLLLTADVVVTPPISFNNNNYQPPRRRYSNISFMNQNRVMNEFVQQYAFQQFTLIDYNITQITSLLHCTEANILQQLSIVGLANIPPAVIDADSSIQKGGSDYPLLQGDEIYFRTLDDTRIKYTLWEIGGYSCSPIPIPTFLPQPDVILEPFPFDDPAKDVVFPVSAPYNPPDDGGLTYVPPPPSQPGLPAGSECQQVEVGWRIETDAGNIDGVDTFFGPVLSLGLSPNPPISPFTSYSALAESRGRVGINPCQLPGFYSFLSGQDPRTITGITTRFVNPL